MPLLFVTLLALQSENPIDLSRYDPACGVTIEQKDRSLRAQWNAGAGSTRAVVFTLDPAKPLIERLEADGKELAHGVSPVYVVTTGARVQRPNERYIFFDKPAEQKHR